MISIDISPKIIAKILKEQSPKYKKRAHKEEKAKRILKLKTLMLLCYVRQRYIQIISKPVFGLIVKMQQLKRIIFLQTVTPCSHICNCSDVIIARQTFVVRFKLVHKSVLRDLICSTSVLQNTYECGNNIINSSFVKIECINNS